MNFHSVETFQCDINYRKRHRSGSTLLHVRACAMGSQSLTSTTCHTSDYWDQSMSAKWAQEGKQIPMNSLSLAYS